MPRQKTQSEKVDPKVTAPAERKWPHWLKVGLGVGGWVTALLVGVLDLPAKINSFTNEGPQASQTIGDALYLDKRLTGAWSSAPEDDVLAKDTDPALDAMPEAPVDVEMRVYHGDVEGSIYANGLEKRYIYSQVQLEGHARGKRVLATAWDVVGGKKVILATIELELTERSGDPVLIFKVIQQFTSYFPKKAILWRTGKIREGGFNPDYLRILNEAVVEARKQSRPAQ